jgi:hypothetical protein
MCTQVGRESDDEREILQVVQEQKIPVISCPVKWRVSQFVFVATAQIPTKCSSREYSFFFQQLVFEGQQEMDPKFAY